MTTYWLLHSPEYPEQGVVWPKHLPFQIDSGDNFRAGGYAGRPQSCSTSSTPVGESLYAKYFPPGWSVPFMLPEGQNQAYNMRVRFEFSGKCYPIFIVHLLKVVRGTELM